MFEVYEVSTSIVIEDGFTTITAAREWLFHNLSLEQERPGSYFARQSD